MMASHVHHTMAVSDDRPCSIWTLTLDMDPRQHNLFCCLTPCKTARRYAAHTCVNPSRTHITLRGCYILRLLFSYTLPCRHGCTSTPYQRTLYLTRLYPETINILSIAVTNQGPLRSNFLTLLSFIFGSLQLLYCASYLLVLAFASSHYSLYGATPDSGIAQGGHRSIAFSTARTYLDSLQFCISRPWEARVQTPAGWIQASQAQAYMDSDLLGQACWIIFFSNLLGPDFDSINLWTGSRIITNKEMHSTHGNIKKRPLPRRRCLVFGWWNCGRGFLTKGKRSELDVFLKENKVDVFGVQEVDIHKTTFFYHDMYKINGYKHVFPLSLEKHGRARCLLYYKEGLDEMITVRKDLMVDDQPIIWIQLGQRNGPLLAFHYREWTGLNGENSLNSQKLRLQEVLSKVSMASRKGNDLYWMGDINVDAADIVPSNNHTNDTLAGLIQNTMLEEGLDQMISTATRMQLVDNVCQESTIDHLYTNVPEGVMNIKVLSTASSDHARILFKRKKKLDTPVKRVSLRSFKNFDKLAFTEEINAIDWEYISCLGADGATDFFTSSVMAALDKHAPLITFTPSKNYNPVISEETKSLMALRDKARSKARTTLSADDIKLFKQLRNKTVGAIKKDKKTAVMSEMEHGTSAWKALNMLRSKAKSANGPPNKLLLDGKVETDSLKMATAMNQYFTNKITKLKEEMEKETPDMDPVEFMKGHLPDNINTLDWDLISTEETEEEIVKLKNSSSVGPNGISNWLMKTAAKALAVPLTLIFNLSISSALFPSSWKHAIVIPLWKKKSKLDPASYRPVSLTCKPSLLFEKLINKRLTEHLQKHQLFCPDQDGYQPGKSTITLTTRAYDKWCRAANSGHYAGVLAVDLSSAFDLVGCDVLVNKAKALGASDSTARWLASYLSGRTQAVRIGMSLSSKTPIPSSIAQGTSIGPRLFLLEVWDLPRCVQYGTVDMFCDDITETVVGSDPFVVANKLESDAGKITQWLINNKLMLAKDKTQFMLATNKEKKRSAAVEDITIVVAGQRVRQSSEMKLLGVVFSKDLTFSSHLHGTQGDNPEKGLIKSLSSILGIIRSIKHCPLQAKKMFLASLFNGKLSFGIEVYGALTEGHLNQLQLIQNRASRLALPGNRNSVPEKLRELGWLTVRGIRRKMDIMTLWKMRIHRSSPYFERWLRTSRLPASSLLPTYETDHGRLLGRSFLIRACDEWNQLPVELRMAQPSAFKRNLKKYLLASQ